MDPNLSDWRQLPKGNKLPNRTRLIVRLIQLVTSRYRYFYLDSDNLYSILVIEYNQSAPRRGQDTIDRVERHTEDNAERHWPGMTEMFQRGTNLEWPKVIFSFRSEMGTRYTPTPPLWSWSHAPPPGKASTCAVIQACKDTQGRTETQSQGYGHMGRCSYRGSSWEHFYIGGGQVF